MEHSNFFHKLSLLALQKSDTSKTARPQLMLPFACNRYLQTTVVKFSTKEAMVRKCHTGFRRVERPAISGWNYPMGVQAIAFSRATSHNSTVMTHLLPTAP